MAEIEGKNTNGKLLGFWLVFAVFSVFFVVIWVRFFAFVPILSLVCVRCCLTTISQNEIKKGIKKEGGVLPHPFF